MLTDAEINKYIKEAVQSSHPIKEVTTVIAIVKEEYEKKIEKLNKEISELKNR